jgi:hypothetical protein
MMLLRFIPPGFPNFPPTVTGKELGTDSVIVTSELVLPGEKIARKIIGNDGLAMAMTGTKSTIHPYDEGPKI